MRLIPVSRRQSHLSESKSSSDSCACAGSEERVQCIDVIRQVQVPAVHVVVHFFHDSPDAQLVDVIHLQTPGKKMCVCENMVFLRYHICDIVGDLSIHTA